MTIKRYIAAEDIRFGEALVKMDISKLVVSGTVHKGVLDPGPLRVISERIYMGDIVEITPTNCVRRADGVNEGSRYAVAIEAMNDGDTAHFVQDEPVFQIQKPTLPSVRRRY